MCAHDDFPDYTFLPKTEFARNLRKSRTPAEKAMWEIVHRPEFKEWRFRQQQPFNSYFLDVAATSIKLAIEIDGDSHDNRIEHDKARDVALAESGWLVLRFRNEDVLHRPHEVAGKVLDTCLARPRFRY